MTNIYSASDYAGLSGGAYSFYYGYEETKNDEWAFVATRKGFDEAGATFVKEIARFSKSELDQIVESDEPASFLLAGIAKLFEQFSNPQ